MQSSGEKVEKKEGTKDKAKSSSLWRKLFGKKDKSSKGVHQAAEPSNVAPENSSTPDPGLAASQLLNGGLRKKPMKNHFILNNLKKLRRIWLNFHENNTATTDLTLTNPAPCPEEPEAVSSPPTSAHPEGAREDSDVEKKRVWKAKSSLRERLFYKKNKIGARVARPLAQSPNIVSGDPLTPDPRIVVSQSPDGDLRKRSKKGIVRDLQKLRRFWVHRGEKEQEADSTSPNPPPSPEEPGSVSHFPNSAHPEGASEDGAEKKKVWEKLGRFWVHRYEKEEEVDPTPPNPPLSPEEPGSVSHLPNSAHPEGAREEKVGKKLRRFWVHRGEQEEEADSTPPNPPPSPEEPVSVSHLPTSAHPEGAREDGAKKKKVWKLPCMRKHAEMVQELHQIEFRYNFKVVGEIGSGAFSDVYRIKRHINKKIYAMKFIRVLFPEVECDVPDEIDAMKKVSGHSLFLKFFSSFSYEYRNGMKEFGIIMEYFPGEDLDKFRLGHPLRQVKVKFLMFQLGTALKYLHSLAIIHCDVKMANILVSKRNMRLKLIDLGVSQRGHYSSKPRGTLQFTAPEILALNEGGPPYTYTADYFSLGIVLHYLIYGRAPPIFQAFESVRETLLQHAFLGEDAISVPEKCESYLDDIKREDLIFMMKLLSYCLTSRLNDDTCLRDPYFLDLPKKYRKMVQGVSK